MSLVVERPMVCLRKRQGIQLRHAKNYEEKESLDVTLNNATDTNKSLRTQTCLDASDMCESRTGRVHARRVKTQRDVQVQTLSLRSAILYISQAIMVTHKQITYSTLTYPKQHAICSLSNIKNLSQFFVKISA